MKQTAKTVRIMCRVFWLHLRSIICSGKWVTVTALSFLIIWFYMENILRFARQYELSVYPAAIPVFFGDGIFCSLGMLLLVFLMSEFPIRSHFEQNVMIRCGNVSWLGAQILVMAATVLLWLAQLEVFVCILLGKNLSFSGGWGKVWGSIAGGTVEAFGYSFPISVSWNLVLYFTTKQAVVLGSLLVWLAGIFFGEFIFLVDGISNHYIGELILAMWSLLSLVSASFKALGKMPFFQMVSPIRWFDISRYANSPRIFAHTMIILVVLIFIFTIANAWLVRKKRIVLK